MRGSEFASPGTVLRDRAILIGRRPTFDLCNRVAGAQLLKALLR